MQDENARQYIYLITTGRRTGRTHEIEIWYGEREGTLFLLAGSGERADWVQNLRAQPAVRVRRGATVWEAHARVVEDAAEEAAARRMLAAKYQGWREGAPLSAWARTALPVALDLIGEGVAERA